jgi:hypothetical protein
MPLPFGNMYWIRPCVIEIAEINLFASYFRISLKMEHNISEPVPLK